MVKANKAFGEIFGDLLGVDKEFMSKMKTKAAQNLNLGAKADAVRGAENLGAARTVLRGGQRDAAAIKVENAGKGISTSPVENLGNETKSLNARNKEGFSEMSADEQRQAFADAREEYDKSLKLNTAWEAAKGYYSEPWKALGNKELSDAARSTAAKQLGARVAVTGGAVALAGGIGHDLITDKEDDYGVGGIAINTVGTAGVFGGAALGLSMLKKL